MQIFATSSRAVHVLSDHRLIGEAVGAALGSRGRPVVTVPWRYGPVRAHPGQRTGRAAGSWSGVLVCELEEPLSLAAGLALVRPDSQRWLVVTSGSADARWGALLESGAGAVITATASLDDLYSALDRMESGGSIPSGGLRAAATRRWGAVPRETRDLLARLERLTPREREILAGLCKGESAAMLSWRLDVSLATVRSQLRAILRKLDVASQIAAVAAVARLEGSEIFRR